MVVCLIAAVLVPLLVSYGNACVGRKLVIGYLANTEQRIMAEVMGILIEERTGTKVTLKEVEDGLEAHRALESGNIQILIEYTGLGLRDVLGSPVEKDPAKAYQLVKDAYNKNFDLIWLKEFGFSSHAKSFQNELKEGIPLNAAPVVRKDTLLKFPALSRLLNKLNGKIDNKIMGGLVAEVEKNGKAPKTVAGEFLNRMGISFSFTPGQV